MVDLAAQFDCAVVGISHFSKGSKGISPQERVIGSQAFGALARLVLVCAKDEENDTRVLARASRISRPIQGGFAYSIVPATLPNGIETTRVQWGAAVEGSVRSILRDVERDAEAAGDQSDECAQALGMALRDAEGRPFEVTSKDVRAKLTAEGYSPKVIRTARERLGVKSRGQGFGQDMKSYWCLPASELDPKTVGFGRSRYRLARRSCLLAWRLSILPVRHFHSCPRTLFVPCPTERAQMKTEGTNAVSRNGES